MTTTFGERLRELRTKAGLSMDALAKEIGTSSSRISDWENKGGDPSSVFIVRLSERFGKSTDWLLKGEEAEDKRIDDVFLDSKRELNSRNICDSKTNLESQFLSSLSILDQEDIQLLTPLINRLATTKESHSVSQQMSDPYSEIPILRQAANGVPITVFRLIDGYMKLPQSYKNCFAVKVCGDSMVGADREDGGYVVVRQQSSVDNGDIALVMIEEEEQKEIAIKRVKRRGNQIHLISENDKNSPLVYSDSDRVHILGKIVESFTSEEAELIIRLFE